MLPMQARFAISIYRAVCTGPPSYWYVDRPLPSGTAKIDRRRSIEGEKEKKKKKRKRRNTKKRRRRKKKTSFPRIVVARGSPARRPRSRAILLLRKETERLPTRGKKLRR
ncbi:hypothetical protein BHE74_00014752, partial [Ensete ventricosum]